VSRAGPSNLLASHILLPPAACCHPCPRFSRFSRPADAKAGVPAPSGSQPLPAAVDTAPGRAPPSPSAQTPPAAAARAAPAADANNGGGGGAATAASDVAPRTDLSPDQIQLLRATLVFAQASVAANRTGPRANATVFDPENSVGCGGNFMCTCMRALMADALQLHAACMPCCRLSCVQVAASSAHQGSTAPSVG
jgi:hypothetical protein